MKFTQITIKDIARELGISPSTVSRALKDHPDISKDTKKAVAELAEKLNYQPNIVAQNLRAKKTSTIGVIIPELVHFFFSTVISGIEDIAHNAGYNVILTQSGETLEREKSNLKTLINSRVDGMLISLSKETTEFDHIEAVLAKGIPIIFYDRSFTSSSGSKGTSSVTVDDFVGAKEATAHLIEQGCRKIAHLQSAKESPIAKERLRGMLDALENNRLDFPSEYLVNCNDGTIEEGFDAMSKLLKLPNRPDGIFANSDVLGMGAINAIKKAGLKIPDDIAVVGFSNWLYSSMVEPPLSSVDQPGFLMGQEAARMLIHQIELLDKDDEAVIVPESKVLKTKLIVRESSLRKKSI